MYNEIRKKYEYSYKELNEIAKSQLKEKKYFVGSQDVLGFYEPSLIDRLRDKTSKKGRFVDKLPKNNSYFVFWYNSNYELIKIKHIDEPAELLLSSNYDVFPIKYEDKQIFLFYDLYNKEEVVKLSHEYLLEYENSRLISVKKCFRYFESTMDCYEENYKYENGILKKAFVNNSYKSECYLFFYGSNGCLESFQVFDTDKENAHIYTTKVDQNTIKAFEKCEMYHFSAQTNGLITK